MIYVAFGDYFILVLAHFFFRCLTYETRLIKKHGLTRKLLEA